VKAGDADVLVDDHFRAQQLGADSRLVHHRTVRRAGRDDRDHAAGLRQRTRHPHEPRLLVLLRVGRRLAHRAPRVGVGAGDEDAPGASVEHRAGDLSDLERGLPLGQHRLGRALAELPMDVGAGKAEVAKRQLREPLERRRRRDLAAPDALEQHLEILSQAWHEEKGTNSWVLPLCGRDRTR
jgi:hypothetical protein